MYRPVAANPHWNVGIQPRVRPGGGPVLLSGEMVRALVTGTRGRRVLVHGARGVLPIGLRGVGLGDKLTDAENLLRAAGYSGAQCRTEEVGFPGGSYRQDVCSAPGFIGGMMVDAILQNRSSGGGVDLAAQRAWDVNNGGQHADSVSYFTTIGKDSVPIVYGANGPTTTSYQEKTTNAPAGGGSAARPVNVTLENVTNPGGTLRVGDSWILRISASSNSAVKGSATQDGKDLGTSDFGSTDANGALTIKGVFEAGNVGLWVQKWTVNGSVGTLTFTVAPKLAVSGGTNTDSSYKGGSGSGSGSGSGTDKDTGSEWSWDTKVFGLPLWAVGGGALAAAFVFGGRR